MNKKFPKKSLCIFIALALFLTLIVPSVTVAAKKEKVKSIQISPKSITIAIGESEQLSVVTVPSNSSVNDLTWISKDPDIATVTPNGSICGVSTGETTITVTTSNNKTADCLVSVKDYTSDNNSSEGELTIKDIELLIDNRINTILSDKQYISIDNIDDYLNSHGYISADQLNELLAEKDYITKDEAEQLISNSCTCLSEEELKELIQHEVNSSGSDVEWEDGVELPRKGDLAETVWLDVYGYDYETGRHSSDIRLTFDHYTVTVNKYHSSNSYYPCKFTVSLSGKLSKESMEQIENIRNTYPTVNLSGEFGISLKGPYEDSPSHIEWLGWDYKNYDSSTGQLFSKCEFTENDIYTYWICE